MIKYHIHPVTGEPKPCSAVKSCPFGGEHYETPEEARQNFEKSMETVILSNLKKPNNDSQFIPYLKELSETIEKVKNTSNDPDAKHALDLLIKNLNKIQTKEELSRLRWIQSKILQNTPQGKNPVREALMFNLDVLEEIENYQEEKFNWNVENAEKFVEYADDDIKYVEKRLKKAIEENDENEIEKWKKELPEAIKSKEKRVESFERIKNEAKEKAEEKYREILQNLSQTKLGNKPYLDAKLGVILGNEAHTVKIVNENPDYIGELSAKDYTEKMKILSQTGENFVKIFSKNGEFNPPIKDSQDSGNSEFEFLAAGMESNAYLHRKTGMVYKIYHKDSLKLEHKAETETTPQKMESSLQRIEDRYKGIDSELLKKNNSEYVETFFIRSKDTSGNTIPIVVQPYLDPEIYLPYDPYNGDNSLYSVAGRSGLNDLHEGNVRINIQTMKVVFFDCIL